MIRYYALGRVVGIVLLLPVLYALAALVGALIPSNAGWTPPERGIRIYIEDNGIHTGIVVPAPGWEDIVQPQDLRDPRYARHAWRSFGWGDRAFYIETPTWWDLRPATVIRAAFGSSSTVMHVDAIAEPRPGPNVRALTLRPEEYARLIAFIRASFAGGAAIPGYYDYDAFYPARGRYDAGRTCNAWVSEALRHAGVRTGAWTPLSASVMLSLP
jgi:uncharacterized protein (TIGR02117 family)